MLRHFLNDFKMVPVALIVTDITFLYIAHVRLLHFRIFVASFLILFFFFLKLKHLSTNIFLVITVVVVVVCDLQLLGRYVLSLHDMLFCVQ